MCFPESIQVRPSQQGFRLGFSLGRLPMRFWPHRHRRWSRLHPGIIALFGYVPVIDQLWRSVLETEHALSTDELAQQNSLEEGGVLVLDGQRHGSQARLAKLYIAKAHLRAR